MSRMQTEEKVHKDTSLCGAVDLLSAIFSVDRDRLRIKYGLSPRSKHCYCEKCGKRIRLNTKAYPYCRYCNSRIEVECDMCGRHFIRAKNQLIGHPTEHIFCSRQCLGRFIGRNFGWGVVSGHPPSCRPIRIPRSLIFCERVHETKTN